jgi:hypothetical protein
MASQKNLPPIHGLMAEFDKPEALVEMARQARAEGFTKVEAFSPMPIHALDDAMGLKNNVAFIVLMGGLAGALTGIALEYWVSVIEYPTNVGGRPWFSWPAFIVPMYETTILFASLSAVLALFVLSGLPQPYHPVFNVPRFNEATRSRFFFLIEAVDPKFDAARAFMARSKPLAIEEVPN